MKKETKSDAVAVKRNVIKSFLVACFAFVAIQSNAQLGGLPKGSTAPDFTVTDLNGTQHHLYSYLAQGKYVLLKFGFINCGSCVMSARSLNWFYNNYGKNQCDVVVISIHLQDTQTDMQNYQNYVTTANPNLLLMGEELPEYAEVPDVYSPSTQTWANDSLISNYNIGPVVSFTLIGPDSTIAFENEFIQSQAIAFMLAPFSLVTAVEDTFGVYGYYYGSDLPNHTIAELHALNGCEALLDGPSAVSELQQIQSLSVSPNPAAETVTLKWTSPVNDKTGITVYDMLGQAVLVLPKQDVRPGTENVLQFETAQLSPGVYSVALQGEKATGVTRFVRR